MRYYRETNGDFLAIDNKSRDYYRAFTPIPMYEGRAAAIEGNVGSVCTTGVALAYLRQCTAIPKRLVPTDWLRAIGG